MAEREVAEPEPAVGVGLEVPARSSAAARPWGLALWPRVRQSPLARRILGGALWSVVGAGVSRALALVAAVLVARRLGAAGFGEYNLVQTTAGMFQALAGFGLGTTATRYLAGRRACDPASAGRIVALSEIMAVAVGAVATAAMVAAAPWLAERVLSAPRLGPSLRLGALLLLLGSFNGAQYGVLAGMEEFRLLAGASGLAALVSIPLLVVGARWGVDGGVAGLVAASVVGTLVYGVAVHRVIRAAGIRPRYREALREWRILFAFSVPATLSNLLLMPAAWIASVVIANQPGGVRELGLFSAANQWRNAVLLVATSAGAALFPVFAELHDTGRRHALARAFWTSFGVLGATCVGGALVLSAGAGHLMRAYGAEFASAGRVLVLMVLTGAIGAPMTVAGHVVSGAGRMWLWFAFTTAWAGALVGLSWALRARGAIGLSEAYLGACILQLALAMIGVQRCLARPGPPPARAPAGP